MKTTKIIYWITTGLLSALVLMSAGMYLFNNAMVQGSFTALGFPLWIIYPLAFFKIAGIATIVSNKFPLAKEWAYAAFFFNFLLAMGAHIAVGDGEQGGAIMALVLLLGSYISGKKINSPQ